MDTTTPPAPLRNVTLFAALVRELHDRDPPDLPGLGVYYGVSGLGKTRPASGPRTGTARSMSRSGRTSPHAA